MKLRDYLRLRDDYFSSVVYASIRNYLAGHEVSDVRIKELVSAAFEEALTDFEAAEAPALQRTINGTTLVSDSAGSSGNSGESGRNQARRQDQAASGAATDLEHEGEFGPELLSQAETISGALVAIGNAITSSTSTHELAAITESLATALGSFSSGLIPDIEVTKVSLRGKPSHETQAVSESGAMSTGVARSNLDVEIERALERLRDAHAASVGVEAEASLRRATERLSPDLWRERS